MTAFAANSVLNRIGVAQYAGVFLCLFGAGCVDFIRCFTGVDVWLGGLAQDLDLFHALDGVITALLSGAVTLGLGYALWYRVLPQLGSCVCQ